MIAKLMIPTALRSFTDNQSQIELSGQTAGDLLKALAEKHPDVSLHLFDETGALRSFVNVFIDGQNIKTAHGLQTPVKDGQTVMLVPAIAGGSQR
ncbi:MAG: MoaD family protein [Deltaproteobacteria bacterium]|jgi:MoaD family protein|nr:MoaD family protein [Deltaproteobacteria bacterium]